MADNKSDQEKTEEPSQKRLDDARKEGNVSVSKEVSSVALMVTAIISFVAMSGIIGDRLTKLFESFFSNAGGGFADQEEATRYLQDALWAGMEMLTPTMISLLVMAVLVNVVQTGGVFSFDALKFKGSKMNPLKGLKNIFSTKGLVELVKGLLKLFIILTVAYFTMRSDINHFVSFIISPLDYSMSQSGSFILLFVTRIMAALLVLSIADAVYQQFQHKKDLRMTKQEVKDEYKQMEGDPHVKGQRRKFGMKLRQQKRMDHAVLASDVVVTNPTHYAVALKYDPEKSNAPIVMVKGKRLRALRIKELAKQYGIPIVENVPVARALYATAEEDEFIPADLYRAVAEILAYVYKLKNKHKV
ncbi:MAG: flagellar biosynthesis protein FlhB [Gracilimonas sp.]|uniref:flagellar biosynthesis protein FlhB n=1 Tax=Gracilimonas TaxID=649462 RepID=UPI001B129FB0|nr:flagellar biosynthesis protein FlhB [Gracilimonas sp.]MBO6586833.1 flagellar biosynthesis protein FlhB [Gracilimonas sp.]MBO6614679.1 flagellar biosynthesis protein FlhB [Gracilimonas sp.]